MRVHRLIRTVLATLAVASGGLALMATPAFAVLTHQYLSQITGINPPTEEFGNPAGSGLSGVAVESNGKLWVADSYHKVVDKFSAAGVYENLQLTGAGCTLEPFGQVSAVVSRPDGGVLVVDNGKKVVDMFSAAGVCENQFNGAATPSTKFNLVLGIGIASDGTMWVGDQKTTEYKVVDEFSAAGVYENLQLTEAGNPLGPFGRTLEGVAVATNGDVLVEDFTNKVVDEFSAAGTYEGQLTGTPSEPFGGLVAIAVAGSSGRIAVGDNTNKVVDEFSAAGVYGAQITVPTRNGTASTVAVTGVAYGPNESLAVADNKNKVVDLFSPPVYTPAVKTGGATAQVTSATVHGEVNPEKADASGFFEYGPCETPVPPETQQEACAKSLYGQTAAAVVEGTQNADFGNGSRDVKVEATVKGLQPNKTYHYRIVGENPYGPSWGAEAEFKTLAIKPVIEGGQQALFLTPHTADLAGRVNPENEPTTYVFQYGPCVSAEACASSPYPYSTTSESAGEGYGGVALYREIEGLQPSTTYHYRLVAENGQGPVASAEGTFTTPAEPAPVEPPPAIPPAAGIAPASGVSAGAATLHGEVDPNNAQTSYSFELAAGSGANALYTIVASGEAGSGGSPVGVAVSLAGLQSGTTYGYRLVATNAYGRSSSAEGTFTTPGFAAAFTQPIAPLVFVTPSVVLPREPPKKLTRAQKLANALKACAKKPKSKRAACRRAAQKRYGSSKSKAKK